MFKDCREAGINIETLDILEYINREEQFYGIKKCKSLPSYPHKLTINTTPWLWSYPNLLIDSGFNLIIIE